MHAYRSGLCTVEVEGLDRPLDAQLMNDRVDEATVSFDRGLALPHDHMAENNVAYAFANAGLDLEKSWKLDFGCSGRGRASGLSAGSDVRWRQLHGCAAQACVMLDTAGWVLYRQGKIEAAEPYLLELTAISCREARRQQVVRA